MSGARGGKGLLAALLLMSALGCLPRTGSLGEDERIDAILGTGHEALVESAATGVALQVPVVNAAPDDGPNPRDRKPKHYRRSKSVGGTGTLLVRAK